MIIQHAYGQIFCSIKSYSNKARKTHSTETIWLQFRKAIQTSIEYHVAHELNFILKLLFTTVQCSSYDNILQSVLFFIQTFEKWFENFELLNTEYWILSLKSIS